MFIHVSSILSVLLIFPPIHTYSDLKNGEKKRNSAIKQTGEPLRSLSSTGRPSPTDALKLHHLLINFPMFCSCVFFRNFYLFKTVVKFQCSVSLNLWVWIPRWLIEPTCSCSLKPQFCCFKSPLIVLGDAVPMISGYTMIYFHSYLGNIMLFASLWRSITMVLYLCK